MSLKQRDVTGGEQLWGTVPGYHLVNYLLRIISVPAETLLRFRFGRRYFTFPNYIAGFVALLAFNYSGVIVAALLTIFGNPIMGGVGLMAMGMGAASGLMTWITYAYIFVGIFHFLEEWVQWNVLGNLRHTFTEGTSWLLPLGKRSMGIANQLLRTGVHFIARFLPSSIREKIEHALPQLALTSDRRFTERFLDPLFLFVLAYIAHSAGETTVGIWLFISIPGINLVTRVRYYQQTDQVLDFIDSFLDSQQFQDFNGAKNRRNNAVQNSGSPVTSLADQPAELMEMVRKKAPSVADAMEAERLGRKVYDRELAHS